jgi:hypothetical protein
MAEWKESISFELEENEPGEDEKGRFNLNKNGLMNLRSVIAKMKNSDIEHVFTEWASEETQHFLLGKCENFFDLNLTLTLTLELHLHFCSDLVNEISNYVEGFCLLVIYRGGMWSGLDFEFFTSANTSNECIEKLKLFIKNSEYESDKLAIVNRLWFHKSSCIFQVYKVV